MATDDLDPVQSQRRANDQLRVAMLQLDEHIVALTMPTMELALTRQKQMAESGLEERDPSDLLKKFVSQAGPGAKIGTAEPGQLNPDASMPTRGAGRAWDEEGLDQQGRGGTVSGIPEGVSPNASSPIEGMNWEQAANMENEPIRIPITGEWRTDAMLKLAAQASGKVAIKQARSKYASQAGEETAEGKPPISMSEFQERQRITPMGKLAGVLNTGASAATYASAIHQKIISPIANLGFGATRVGASLGYSAEGGSLGPQAWHGIPNPLAAFGSAGGRQGTGLAINAAEAAFGGTGISFHEASQLRGALGQQGWSNQRSGGLLASTVGGENESLALAMEPLVKKGFKNPEVLAEFGTALKLGTGNIKELTSGIETLSETAKDTHQTLEAEAIKAHEFMAKAVEGGSTMMHGLTAYGEIGKATKMNPLLIQGINEGQFGQIQAMNKGILPWEVQGMSGNAAAMNAYETVKKVAGYVPKQSDTRTFNKITGKYETTESAAQKEGAWIHMLEPSVTAEEATRLKKIGPSLEATTGGIGEAKTIQQHRHEMEEKNMLSGSHYHEINNAHLKATEANAQLEKVEHERVKAGKPIDDPWFEQQREIAKEKVSERQDALRKATDSAKKSGALHKGTQEDTIRQELGGAHGLYATAQTAGVSATELQAVKKEDLWKQAGDIQKKLENLNKVNVEKENQDNAKIELAGDAKAYFKLKFPSASAKANANAGGPSTASQAADPSTGETAANASLLKSAEKAGRREPTTGAH